MKKLFLSTLLLALPLLASAYDISVENADGVTIYYNYIKDGTELEVAGVQRVAVVNIPEEVTYMSITRRVTAIGNKAFKEHPVLKTVVIPNSVTCIGANAFYGCTRLTSANISNTVTSIEYRAFYDCPQLSSVNIPNSVTFIGDEALSMCSSLISVDLPNTLTSIGEGVFRGCSSLTSVVIPNSVTRVGDYAFRDCSNLTSVVIPNSVTYIGIYAFYGCSSLNSVTIPNSVTTLGRHAFADCMGLQSVSISDNLTSLNFGVFANCSNLTSVTIPNSVTSIGRSAFYGCSSLISITIPSSVEDIGDWAFSGCSSLIWVNIYGAYIGNYAFENCTSLAMVISKMEYPTSITQSCFPESVYKNAILYVPKGTRGRYNTKNYSWGFFKNIVEGNPFVHTLTYLVDGETYLTYTLEEGDEITPEEAPTKEGYTFSGWSEIPETMPASDLTITGTFVPNKYKLTYFVDGGEYKTSEVEFGSAITAEENPTKEGYTFSGWSEIPETMPASDVTITGSFTINKYKLTYTLDGEEYKTAEVDYGTALTPEEAPVKEGYTFSGWSEIPETMPANDVTVTGTFSVNKYKLTYMVDGEEYKASEVDYGTAITAEAVPTKEGYTFSGWSEIPSTMPAEDVTVTGTFTVNKYTITYMVDDAVLMTEEVAYGSTIAPPKSQKDGYDILWSFYPTTMPAYSITINGTYTTGISSLNVEESERQVFTPDGKRVETPKKGLNIIRMSDGTVKKVVVK